MTLDQLRYALELQTQRNFSRAAEACHITQPSLSVQIAKLEEELDVVLFHRSRSGVEITEQGKEVLKQARVILDESERLRQIASDLKGEVRGEFRLGVIPTLAPTLLPLFLRKFGKAYPGVQLSVIEEPTERLVAGIDQGKLDGAILSTPAKGPDSLIEKVLFYEPFVVFASKGHALLNRKTVSSDQIGADDVLLLDETHCLRDQVLQLCRSKAKNAGKKPALRLQSTGLQTLVEYLRHNEGFTLLPGLSARLLTTPERRDNVRPFEKPTPSRKVSLIFHRSHLKRSVLEALKETILKTLPEDSVFLPSSSKELRVLSPGPEHFEI